MIPPAQTLAIPSVVPVVSADLGGPGNVPTMPQFPPPPWAAAQASASRTRAHSGTPLPRIPPSRVRSVQAGPHAVQPMSVNVNAPSTTGVNAWWTYEEHAIPGVGKAMVNVANGNLMVQVNDVDVPERGIDLAFRRTYNSQSTHDYANTDGSVPSNFGNGWTNTFDAHIASNSGGGISVYDIDGARYDYGAAGQGQCLVQPTGVYETLCPYPSTGTPTAYEWTKKTGTVYQFFVPTTGDAYAGRLQAIFARNNNNSITFTYSWKNNDSSSAANLVRILASHSDGQHLILTFGNAFGYQELQSIQRPDGLQVTYTYDTTGDLTNVCEIGNNTTDPGDLICTAPDPHNHHQYSYSTGPGEPNTYQLAWVNSPNWAMSAATCGAVELYGYDAQYRLSSIANEGTINPLIADGTNGSSFTPGCVASGRLLQPGVTGGAQIYFTETFSGNYGGTETASDTDGHQTTWTTNSAGLLLKTQEYGGPASPLTTYERWDANNDLTGTIDARGYETDYAYDTNGNTIAVALPAVTIGMATFRPTSLYSYQVIVRNGVNVITNNIIAYCDPVQTHANLEDWTAPPPPSDSLCASGTGAVRYSWNTADTLEPFGFLTDTYTPLYDGQGHGYHYAYAYTTSKQGGDFGLPTDVTGDAISQPIDSSTLTRTPHQYFTYDSSGYGNLVSYSTGLGSPPGSSAWSLSYDSNNRLSAATDPDGVTSRTCYYHNGQVQIKQSAQQYAMDGNTLCGSHSTAYTYDGDLNETTETHHFGCVPNSCTAGITYKWYDAADRLVEVHQPHDASDVFANPWSTRYFYDLTQGQTVTITGATTTPAFKAYGNLFKTQELLMPGQNQQLSAGGSNTQWTDLAGTAYDALDRPVTKYQLVTDLPQTETFVYDQGGLGSANGLLVKHCLAVNPTTACSEPVYDADGHVSSVTYLDSNPATPGRTYTYDADGRTLSIAEPTVGTQSYTFDQDGRVSTSTDPAGGTLTVTSSATLTYHYYPDGKRSSVDVASTGLTQSALFAYAYRTDGKLERQQINDPGNPKVGSSVLSFTSSLGGRLLSRAENVPGQSTAPLTYGYDINTSTNTGLMTSASFPAANLSSMSYDAESQPLGYSEAITGSSPDTVSMTYTDRGELLRDSRDPYPAPGAYPPAYADGLRIAGDAPQVTLGWDARRGVLNGAVNPENSNAPVYTYAYDIAGRQTSYTKVITSRQQTTCDEVTTRQYDAENRIIFGGQTPFLQTNCASAGYYVESYDWGPNGHPARIGSAPSQYHSAIVSDTLHWDGDQLLFTTDSQGHVDDIKIGDQADITPQDPTFTGLTFWDHFDGTLAFCHNSTGSAGSDTNGARISSQWTGNVLGCLKMGTQTMQIPSTEIFSGDLDPPLWSNFKGVGQGGILGMARSDGIQDGFNVIQGARTYDPSSGGWTTPDEYAGDVHDPMSQKAYMWNANKPVSYTDPTGFAPSPYEPENYFLLGDSYTAAATELADDGQALGVPGPGEIQMAGDFAVTLGLVKMGKQPVPGDAHALSTLADELGATLALLAQRYPGANVKWTIEFLSLARVQATSSGDTTARSIDITILKGVVVAGSSYNRRHYFDSASISISGPANSPIINIKFAAMSVVQHLPGGQFRINVDEPSASLESLWQAFKEGIE